MLIQKFQAPFRFNGATPQQAWKGHYGPGQGHKGVVGFNGATPQQAWKEQHQKWLKGEAGGASMGPRLNRRGKYDYHIQPSDITFALQWGHASTGVERL